MRPAGRAPRRLRRPGGATTTNPAEPAVAQQAETADPPAVADLLRPTPSGIFIALLTFAFAFTFWQTFEWTSQAARLPRVITVVGLALIAIYVAFHLAFPSSERGRIMDIGRTLTGDTRRVLMMRTVKASARHSGWCWPSGS